MLPYWVTQRCHWGYWHYSSPRLVTATSDRYFFCHLKSPWSRLTVVSFQACGRFIKALRSTRSPTNVCHKHRTIYVVLHRSMLFSSYLMVPACSTAVLAQIGSCKNVQNIALLNFYIFESHLKCHMWTTMEHSGCSWLISTVFRCLYWFLTLQTNFHQVDSLFPPRIAIFFFVIIFVFCFLFFLFKCKSQNTQPI